jgi:hypothetical protein
MGLIWSSTGRAGRTARLYSHTIRTRFAHDHGCVDHLGRGGPIVEGFWNADLC